MPQFDTDPSTLDIYPDEYVEACSSKELEQLIEELDSRGFVVRAATSSNTLMSAPEKQFEEALSKLHGKWNMLSEEEEQIVLNISKRF